jgi:hypothetical protein
MRVFCVFFCFFRAKIWPAAAGTGELARDLRDQTPCVSGLLVAARVRGLCTVLVTKSGAVEDCHCLICQCQCFTVVAHTA